MSKKKTKQDFADYLLKQVANHSCYLWGGQGEYVAKTTPAKVKEMEQGNHNAYRVLNRVANLIDDGIPISKARYFDCSGLGVLWLLKYGYIDTDLTAHGLYLKCTPIKKEQLEIGDFVFKTNSDGRKVHIGYCVGDDVIVEAYGRDDGVVSRNVSKGAWDSYGRPTFW